MAASQTLGAKVGPRVADLVSRAVVSTIAQSTGHKVEVGQLLVNEVLRALAADLSGLKPPWLKSMAQSDKLAPEMQAYLAELAGTPNFVSIVGHLFGILGVMQASGRVGANYLEPTVEEFLSASPNSPLDAGTVAALYSHGWLTLPEAYGEAANTGFNQTRTAALINAAYQQLPVQTLHELVNRGVLSDGLSNPAVDHLAIDPEYRTALKSLRYSLLPPAVLAEAVLKGWIDEGEARTEAAKQGVTADRLNTLTLVTGEPPGLMQLLEAYRRDLIDRERLHHGIRESRVRNEWIDVVEGLRYMPPGPATCIEGAVKGHLTPAESKAKAERAGLDPDEWEWMYRTTGNPPGNMQMLELLNRGEVSEERVIGALKQGHLANAYIPDVLKLKRALIPQGTLLLIQQSGGLDKKQTIHKLMELGYTETDAGLLADAGSRSKISQDWNAAKQIVTDQYELGIVDRESAAAYLTTVGFEHDEAAAVLTIADLKRAVAQQSAAITRVRTLYVSHQIDGLAARNALVGLGVPASQVGVMLDLWTLERDANVRSLTEAQIVAAYGYEILTQAEAQARLEQLGYPPLEAWTLLSIKSKSPLPNKPPALSSVSPTMPIG